MLPVEVPLLADYVEAIDQSIKKGIHVYDWNSDGLIEFVNHAKEACISADEMMTTLKTNLGGIDEILDLVSQEPLLIRQPKPVSPSDLQKQNKDMLKDRTCFCSSKMCSPNIDCFDNIFFFFSLLSIVP